MKIVFLDLFTIAIGKLAIPGGVLDLLVKKKNPGTRLVLLTTEGHKKSLERFEGENVVIESVPVTKEAKENLLKTVFYFFYSYLIFTGTTKLLATFGARADLPPAGGNRHLAPLKAAVANTFGRSKFVKTKFVPWAFKKIYNKRPYAYLFEKYSPDLIFMPNVAFLPDQEFAAEAQRRGVKTIGMATNWDHLNKYYIPIHADYLITQNEPMKEEAVELHEYNKDQVVVTGFPQFDQHFHYKKYIGTREEFFKKFNIPINSKLIVFFSGAAYSLDEPDILQEISKWIKASRFSAPAHIMLRPYITNRDLKSEASKYKMLAGDPNISFNWTAQGDADYKDAYYGMYEYADVVISIFSTTAIEAALFDKPTLAIGFDGYKQRPYHESIKRLEDLSHFRHVLDTGSVKIIRGFDDLYQNLEKYFKDPKLGSDQRKLLIDKMCYKADGKASERIADFILSKVNG